MLEHKRNQLLSLFLIEFPFCTHSKIEMGYSQPGGAGTKQVAL
jgi:hypothetical protein